MATVVTARQKTPDGLRQDLLELTSLRFFAAFYVVLFHIHDKLAQLSSISTNFFQKGYIGVDLFFILSGFILTHAYLDKYLAGKFDYRQFLLFRIARIYPLHLVMTLVFVAFYAIGTLLGVTSNGQGMRWDHLGQHLLMLHAWGTTDWHSWNFPSWSISAEFFAYLLFPIYLLTTRIPVALGLALSVALYVAFYFIVEMSGARLTALMFNFGILRIVPEFLLGVFIYLFIRKFEIASGLAKFALGVTVIGLLVGFHLGISDIILVPVLGFLILLIGTLSLGSEENVLRSKPLVYLGEISYSTYMVHILVLICFTVLSRKLGSGSEFPLVLWLVMLAAIYVASAASYHFVEHPARALIRRWSTPKPGKKVGRTAA
ncbi:MAG: acyltransferase family protein [Hyphomicrobiaceae bacterium]